jgi:hypothetical protein
MPTRVGTGSADFYGGSSELTGDSYLFGLGTGAAGGAAGGTSLGIRNTGTAAGLGILNTPLLRNQAVTGPGTSYTGQPVTSTRSAIFEVGNLLAPNQGAGKAGPHGVHVFWRGYVEDLTVSGRTYAEADAIDIAEFTKQVLTSGGRYYGDTIVTAPSTIP